MFLLGEACNYIEFQTIKKANSGFLEGGG